MGDKIGGSLTRRSQKVSASASSHFSERTGGGGGGCARAQPRADHALEIASPTLPPHPEFPAYPQLSRTDSYRSTLPTLQSQFNEIYRL
jgi:hypothetical protein